MSTPRVDAILDEFDFERVHRAMVALDWRWVSPGVDGVPEIPDLRRRARGLLDDLEQHPNISMMAAGGFRAESDQYEKLCLSFEIDRVDEQCTYDSFASHS